MTDPNQQSYNNPEERAYHAESLLTREALRQQFDVHSDFTDPESDTTQLGLVEPLTDARWSITCDEGVVSSFERYFVDDTGTPTTSVMYYFDDASNLRSYTRNYTAYPVEEKVQGAGAPPEEEVENLNEEERERMFKALLPKLLADILETFDLEKDLDDDIVEPADQRALRRQLADTIPRVR